MYNIEEEQEIARAVASKVNSGFSDVGMASGESFFEVQKAYTNTLQQRALRFLKELDKKIDSLSNQEVANLLRVLLASGTVIESEEELEYWVAFLERVAMQRISNLNDQLASGNQNGLNDAKGMLALVDVLKLSYLKKQPQDKLSPEFAKWQEMMKNFSRTEQQIQQGLKNRKKSTRRSKHSQEENTSDDQARDRLISKMAAAGVPTQGPYWNDVLASYENATDKMDFVARWAVDEARRDEEKKQNDDTEKQKGTSAQKPQKQEKKPEKSDHEKIEELRMGKQQKNEEKIDSEFQNPGNAKAVKEFANQKLEKTGKEITEKDIARIKVKIAGGR